jgi:1-phosphatidylinositol-3-phosphate 5-kinase
LALQFAVFAAYQLSLETSYLADEGAILPKIPSDLPVLPFENHMNGGDISSTNRPHASNDIQIIGDRTSENGCIMPLSLLDGSSELLSTNLSPSGSNFNQEEYVGGVNATSSHSPILSLDNGCVAPLGITVHRDDLVGGTCRVENDLDNGWHHISDEEHAGVTIHDHNENLAEYFPTSDNAQSILVSLSIACPQRRIVCKQSQLLRIKFYGNFDKPLGRYFREDLFNQVLHSQTYLIFCLLTSG